jgi:hypothetical protein
LKVFDAIRQVKPSRLYVSADGARPGNEKEAVLCEKVRQICTTIDWPCELFTKWQPENLGGPTAISQAIDWFFEHEEQGVILEDDTLPSQAFFSFCADLLEVYKHDEHVMCIGGFNYGQVDHSQNADYFFSAFPVNWGWATWRRAWSKFSWSYISRAQSEKRKDVSNYFSRRDIQNYYVERLGSFHWDYQWYHTIWKHKGICIFPNKTLIKNLGFGKLATHTNSKIDHRGLLPLEHIQSSLKHPTRIERSEEVDEKIYDWAFRPKGKLERWLLACTTYWKTLW